MTDEEWDVLPSDIRVKVMKRGEEALGGGVYAMPKELFYEFADRAVKNIAEEEVLNEERYKEFLQQRHDPKVI